jgi:hypothetical protein
MGGIVDGEEWQENVYYREEWKKLQRTARSHCILHIQMEYNRINRTEYNNLGLKYLDFQNLFS